MPALFSVPADAAEPLADTASFLTDVLEASDGTEQRVQLRSRPRRTLDLSITGASQRAAALAANILRGNQAAAVHVPFWQYASRLSASVGQGATTLLLDTASVPWRAGGLAAVTTDPWTSEVVTVQTVGVGQLTLQAPGTALAWPAGAVVVPVGSGRFEPAAGLEWRGLEALRGRLRFALDPTVAPIAEPAAWSGPTYAGYPVLDATELNRPGPVSEGFERKVSVLDTGTGALQVDAHAGASRTGRDLHWLARSRAEAATLRSFLEGRRGRALPFWVPSLQADLRLTADTAFASQSLVVSWVGYTEHVWPHGRQGRHLAIFVPGFGIEYRKVITATHTPGAATETLTMDTGAGHLYPASRAVVMLLRFSRLDTDEPAVAWRTRDVAEARFAVRELPDEEPL